MVRVMMLTVFQNEKWTEASENLSIKTVYTSAPRGEIRDRYGRLLAGNKSIFVINLVAAEVQEENINTVALNLINLLESNGDLYYDDFPIGIDAQGNFYYTYEKKVNEWLVSQDLSEDFSAQEAFDALREREGIDESLDVYEAQSVLQNTYSVYPPISVKKMEYTSIMEMYTFLENFGLSEKDDQGKVKYVDAREAFYRLRDIYDIDSHLSDENARKILLVRNALKNLGYKSYIPAEIASGVSQETIIMLEERADDFPGVEISQEFIRYYPEGQSACHILGYMGKISESQQAEYLEKGYSSTDLIGKEGIERYYESALRGRSGEKNIEVNAKGQQVSVLSSEETQPGKDVYLTIDLELQKVAEDALQQALKEIQRGGVFRSKYGNYDYGTAYKNAKAGAAVAVDVDTGEVLALANYPGYDPNLFTTGISSEDWASLQGENPRDPLSPLPLYNIATMTSIQPGSTFKPVTALAALDAGWNESWKLYDDGAVRLGNKTYGCWIWNSKKDHHGYLDLIHALEVSCNYFFYDLGAGRDFYLDRKLPVDISIQDVLQYASELGLGSKTGIELTESAAGIPVKTDKENATWNIGDALNLSIGQGENAYTPVQMARYVAAIANGGTLYDLTLTKSIEGIDKEKSTGTKVENKNPDAFEIVQQGMNLVASGSSGTSRSLFSSFPYKVGAKTGTAQKSGKINPPDEVEYIRTHLSRIAPGLSFKEVETEMRRLLSQESDVYKTESVAIRRAVLNLSDATVSDIDAYKSDYDNFSWFVSYAPADDPQIAVAVLIFQGGSGSYAGPVAREIIGRFMELQEGYTTGTVSIQERN
ncbi:MAG: hypothetical protein IKV96_02135 [Firmicutes bacterium]|nr:hypothetical protein [Bacillota bacterium]